MIATTLKGLFPRGRFHNATKNLRRSMASSRQEHTVIKEIPYTVHFDERTVKTEHGGYVRSWKIEGMPFLTAPDSYRNELHEELCRLFIGRADVQFYTNTVRTKVCLPESDEFTPGSFAYGLNKHYRQSLANDDMYVNQVYLSVVYTPENERTRKFFEWKAKQKEKKTPEVNNEKLAEQLKTITLGLERGMKQYQMTALSTYEHNGYWFSAQLELYQFLLDGVIRRSPLMRQNLQKTMLVSRPIFGYEKGELRAAPSTYHIAALGIKGHGYPKQITPGRLSVVLGLRGEFVLTQTFVPLSKAVSLNRADEAVKRQEQTESRAVSQRDEMSQGGEGNLLDDLTAGRYVLGEYHFALVLKSRTVDELGELIAQAVTTFGEVGIALVREDVGTEATYWSQLPGQHLRYRPRPDTMTSRNAAGLMAPYGEFLGSQSGNHWGRSTALLRTVFSTPYHFNFHVRDVGHTFICGPTGSGKTTAQLFLAAMQSAAGLTQVFFDYGLGSAVYTRAMGGNFFNIDIGVETGWNPFQMEPTPQNVGFVTMLFHRLAKKSGHTLSQTEHSQLDKAVVMVFKLPKHMRRPARLLDFIDPTDKDGLDKKLARWVQGGAMAWLFDCEKDTIDFDRPVTSVNIKNLLDNDEVRAESMMYLFYRVGLVKDGRRLRIDIGEFWRALDDEFFVDWLQAFFNTARKDDAMLVAETQSPEKVANSKIAHTVIGQTSTKIYLWNLDASRKVYMESFGLTETEFNWVKKLGRERMLLKQTDGTSVILELNLGASGLRGDLAVLSGTSESAREVEELIAEVGNDPKVWRPIWNSKKGFPAIET